MKIRAVLNGIAALAAIGAFYTFAFCMVDDVDDASISQEYYYNTATETAPTETMIASANKITLETYHREIAETPMDKDAAHVNNSIDVNLNYEAAPSDDITENIVVTPLTDAEDKTVTTSVPVSSAEDEAATESAGADIPAENIQAENNDIPEDVSSVEEFDDVPEDIEGDMIISENHMDTAQADYMDALSYNNEVDDSSIEEINKKMEELEEALTQTTTDTVFSENTEAFTTTAPTNIITSLGTHFETVPAFSETTSQTSESIVTESPEGAEVFTAKVDGVVQEFDAYELVCMIVSTEMSPYFNQEALKAQAVAAYSYVKYHNVNGLVPSVLVKRDIPEEVKQAVSSVWGKCCYYNGEVAQTVYTASTAGTSAASVNVWGGSVPYLTSVATPFDVQSDPNYGVIATFTKDDVKSSLENSLGITLSDSPENWFTITSRVDGNYVSGVNIDGQLTVSGRKIRESVLKYRIKSWCFDVSYADDEFTFVTYGYGHGVGMSQNGANILAKQGYTYDQILTYYFSGITVE